MAGVGVFEGEGGFEDVPSCVIWILPVKVCLYSWDSTTKYWHSGEMDFRISSSWDMKILVDMMEVRDCKTNPE